MITWRCSGNSYMQSVAISGSRYGLIDWVCVSTAARVAGASHVDKGVHNSSVPSLRGGANHRKATTITEAEVTDVTKTDRTQNSLYLHKQRFLLFYFLLICATIEIGKGKLAKARWVHMTKARLPRIFQDENSSILTTATHVRGRYGRWRSIQEGQLGQHQCLRLHSLRQAARPEEHAWSLARAPVPSILTTRRAGETSAIQAFETHQVSAFMEISFRIADSAKSVLGSTEGPKAAWGSL